MINGRRAHALIIVLEDDDLAVVGRVVVVERLAKNVFENQHSSRCCNGVEILPRCLRLGVVLAELGDEPGKRFIYIFKDHFLLGVILVSPDKLLDNELLVLVSVALRLLKPLNDLLLGLVSYGLIFRIWVEKDYFTVFCHKIILVAHCM